jgi:hypothetical protein
MYVFLAIARHWRRVGQQVLTGNSSSTGMYNYTFKVQRFKEEITLG